jgi:tight adherence protein C
MTNGLTFAEVALMAGIVGLILLAVVYDRAQRQKLRFVERLGRYGRSGDLAKRRHLRRDIIERTIRLVLVVARPIVAALFGRERDRKAIRQLLWSAGFRADNAVSLMAAAKAAFAIGASIAAYFLVVEHGLLGMGVLIDTLAVAGGLVVGGIVPEYALNMLAHRRREQLRESLPDAIDLMVIAAEAGLALDMAIDRVRRELQGLAPALAGELAITMAELQALPDRAEAFRNLGDRTGIKEVQHFASALMQTVRYGTPFAKSLKALGTDLRQARMIALEERGAKLPALLSLPLILFIMPAVFIVVVGPAIVAILETFS